jgi:hypothetical protein
MRNIVAGFAESGMTRREYSAKHNIGIATLDYWRRVERKSRPKLVEVAIETQPQASGGFALVPAHRKFLEFRCGRSGETDPRV